MPERKGQDITPRKFLFDLHRFDAPEPEPEPEEDIPPPPPTFSEDELAAAKASSYEEGKVEGMRLAAQSREQMTTNTLRAIAESFSMLFAGEYDREKIYEQESVRLTLETLKQLFPALNARFGQDEITDVIVKVMQGQARKSSITVDVSGDDAPAVESFLAGQWTDPETAPRYRVMPHKDLNPGQCRLSWEDGGAVRDAVAMAEQIAQSLTDLLGRDAPKAPQTVSNTENNAINEQDAGESPSSTAPTGETA